MSYELNPSFLKHKVSSSQINEISFDEKENRLYVVFHNNSIYSYAPFTLEQFNEFKDAPSIGKYFYQNVKKLTTTKMKNGN